MKTNNYIKYTTLAIIIIGGINTALSQVPGFMGKKITVSGGAYLGHSLGSPAKVGSTDAGLDKRFYLGADYVIARRWTAGIEYQRLGTATELSFDNNAEAASGKGGYTYALKANTYKFYFTRFGFGSDFLAPVGRYFTMGLLMVNYTITDEKGYIFNPGRDLFKGSNVGISFELGKKRVFYKQLVLDYGLQLAFILPKKRDDESSLVPQFTTDGSSRLFNAHVINFKIGLGWLLSTSRSKE